MSDSFLGSGLLDFLKTTATFYFHGVAIFVPRARYFSCYFTADCFPVPKDQRRGRPRNSDETTPNFVVWSPSRVSLIYETSRQLAWSVLRGNRSKWSVFGEMRRVFVSRRSCCGIVWKNLVPRRKSEASCCCRIAMGVEKPGSKGLQAL